MKTNRAGLSIKTNLAKNLLSKRSNSLAHSCTRTFTLLSGVAKRYFNANEKTLCEYSLKKIEGVA